MPFIETFAGSLYSESESEIRAANLTYSHLQASALSATESLRFLRQAAKQCE